MLTNLEKKKNKSDSRFTKFQASYVKDKPIIILGSGTNSGLVNQVFHQQSASNILAINH
jgi:hypothetical protein